MNQPVLSLPPRVRTHAPCLLRPRGSAQRRAARSGAWVLFSVRSASHLGISLKSLRPRRRPMVLRRRELGRAERQPAGQPRRAPGVLGRPPSGPPAVSQRRMRMSLAWPAFSSSVTRRPAQVLPSKPRGLVRNIQEPSQSCRRTNERGMRNSNQQRTLQAAARAVNL